MRLSMLIAAMVLFATTALEAERPKKLATSNLGRGIALVEKGNLDGAIAAFGEAIRLDPGNVTAYVKRAILWLVKRDQDKALSDFALRSGSIRNSRTPTLAAAWCSPLRASSIVH